MSSKFTHVVANVRISFLQAKWHLIVMNHMVLIHSSVSGHVGCLYILRVYSVSHWCPTLTTRTVACQAPLSMEFSRQDYWSGFPLPTSGGLLNPGIEPVSPAPPALVGRLFTVEPHGKPFHILVMSNALRYVRVQIFLWDSHFYSLDIYTKVGLLGHTGWHYWQRARLSMQEIYRRRGFDPWVRKIPWRRKCPPTPVFLPGKFHGHRSLGLQSMMQQKVRHNWVYTHTHTHTHTHKVSIFSFLRNLYTVSHRDFTNLGCYQQ